MEIKVNSLNLKIKKGSKDDYRFCYNLAKKNMYDLVIKNLGKWNHKAYLKSFNETENYLVFEKSRRVAFFRIKKEDKNLSLEDIQVSSKLQGKGIGLELMKIIEKIADQKRINTITLTVFKENKAKNLYKRLGFKKVKSKKGSRILMEKKLN